MDAHYDELVRVLVDEAVGDDQVTGLLLTGSVARGDALPGTDIDVRYLLADGLGRPFRSAPRDGILVEQTFADIEAARDQLRASPMHIYAYLDGRILYDPHGDLASLRTLAREHFETYEVSDHDRRNLSWLLQCSRDKIDTARSGGDLLKAAFATGTSSWQIMEGLWAANNRPLPPNSSVRPHLSDLTGPPGVVELYAQLFLADTERRIAVALELIDWSLARLS